jgi:hypothetical protein
MQKSGQQFKQAPMVLPKENLPNTSQFEDPLINKEKVNESESLTPLNMEAN